MLPAFKILKFIFRHLIPVRLRYPAARGMAWMVLCLSPARRRVIVQNLTPLVGAERARRMAPILFGHFCMTAVDFFCPRRSLLRSVQEDNGLLIEKMWRKTRRVMLVTAHLGNWELGISYLVDRGFSVAGVYAPYREDEVVQWILAHRHPDVEWIPSTRGAVDACIDALRRGRLLGMVGDIPFGERGRRVFIAGRAAHVPLGPWAIAVRAGATVLPAFIVRETPGRYRVVIHDPIPTPAEGSFRFRMERMQDAYLAHLERYLARFPEQWGVLQPFWDP